MSETRKLRNPEPGDVRRPGATAFDELELRMDALRQAFLDGVRSFNMGDEIVERIHARFDDLGVQLHEMHCTYPFGGWPGREDCRFEPPLTLRQRRRIRSGLIRVTGADARRELGGARRGLRHPLRRSGGRATGHGPARRGRQVPGVAARRPWSSTSTPGGRSTTGGSWRSGDAARAFDAGRRRARRRRRGARGPRGARRTPGSMRAVPPAPGAAGGRRRRSHRRRRPSPLGARVQLPRDRRGSCARRARRVVGVRRGGRPGRRRVSSSSTWPWRKLWPTPWSTARRTAPTTTCTCASSATRTRSPSRWWTAATAWPPRPSARRRTAATSGRGIHFMRALADAVHYTCGPLGTRVLLVKQRS